MEKRPRPKRAPARPRTPRRRTEPAKRRPHAAAPRATAPHEAPATVREEDRTTPESGGTSGFGPPDLDGYGGDGRGGGDDDRGPLLIVLGILAIGAGLLSARLLTRSATRGSSRMPARARWTRPSA